MQYFEIYLWGLVLILGMMTTLWMVSVIIKNASIVDLFWGAGYVFAAWFYFFNSTGLEERKFIVLILTTVWGLRLSVYLAWRNIGKGEDFRYQEFRRNYGENRYWWISFFQTYLLQGVLMWLLSATLLGTMQYGWERSLNVFDIIGLIFWLIGFVFEFGGDLQLAKFKANADNKGKVLNTGFWRYTRHPNYFGDAAVWWGYGFFCIAAGSYLPVMGSIIMTFLLIKVSGVAMLEKSLKKSKPEYQEYIRKTSSFIPWIPKK